MASTVGFVGFGEVNSPIALIERKCREAARRLSSAGCSLECAPVVTDDSQGLTAARALAHWAGQDLEALVVCIAGWIPSHAVIKVISRFRDKPMVLWGLSGHYEQGRLVTTAPQAGTSALRQVMVEMGFRFIYVWDALDGESCTGRVISYLRAASAKVRLQGARIGIMGCRDMGLYGTLYEPSSLRAVIGCELEHFEMLEIMQRIERLAPEAIRETSERVRRAWTFSRPPSPGTVETGVKHYLALREKAVERGYQGISLIDVDGMKKLAQCPPSMIFMLLADEANLCTIPENDSLGAVTQLIVKHLTGQIGAYFEFYEFLKHGALMGVPDFVPAEVVDGAVTVEPTAFGDFAEGLLNISKVKTGTVTLCRLACLKGRYVMHLATGKAAAPRPWEEAGWRPPAPQLPSLEISLHQEMDDFGAKVLGQHYILSYGDNEALLRDYCSIEGIEIW